MTISVSTGGHAEQIGAVVERSPATFSGPNRAIFPFNNRAAALRMVGRCVERAMAEIAELTPSVLDK